jgi:hypothetical protein
MNKIKLSDGTQAISFIGEDKSPKAVVYLSVIQALAALLPRANVRTIIDEFITKLNHIKSNKYVSNEDQLAAFVDTLKGELHFHESVNLIKEFKMPTVVDEVFELITNVSKAGSAGADEMEQMVTLTAALNKDQSIELARKLVEEYYIQYGKQNTNQPDAYSVIMHEEVYDILKEKGIDTISPNIMDDLRKFTAFRASMV